MSNDNLIINNGFSRLWIGGDFFETKESGIKKMKIDKSKEA